MRGSENRRGFTLVELLVVIVIIGVLLALLLPAVQGVREAGRRLTCRNNIRQLGVALTSYHTQYGTYPPSAIDKGDGGLHANWVIMILPFADQTPLWEQFDLNFAVSSPVNQLARATRLEVMACPSDTYNREPFHGSGHGPTASFGDNWARGNYGANGALAHRGPVDSDGWSSPTRRGVMGVNVSLSTAGIRDGTSQTILVGEVRAGVCPQDERGTWAMANCASSLWAHGGVDGDAFGPNNKMQNSDDSLGCSQAQTAAGGATALAKMGMGCFGEDVASGQQGARSLHAGGINACFVDGSVHFLRDEIDAQPSTDESLSVWDRLNASSDEQDVEADSY